MKEQAIEKLYEKYSFLNCKINESIQDLTKPGIGWVNKNCKDCECCEYPKKKKKKKETSY